MFPCPLCGEGRVVRASKRNKPYLVCNGCGVQLFVRTEDGIKRLRDLMDKAENLNFWEHLAKLKDRYKKKCPQCGKAFWISEELIVTSWLDGGFRGYRCLECGETVKPEVQE